MESKRVVKRKSPSTSGVYELSDNDVSSAHSDSDCDGPRAKIIKTESKFVDSVVLALSNLESENNLKNELIKQPEETDLTELVTASVTANDRSDTQEGLKPSCENQPSVQEVSQNSGAQNGGDLEEGEVDDNSTPAKLQSKEAKSSESEHCLHITFSNESMADSYKFKFLKFIESFVELEIESEDKLTINIKRDPLLKSSEWIIVDEYMVADSTKKETVEEELCYPLPITPEKSKKKKKKPKKEKNLFVLDTNPQNETGNDSCAKYSSKFQIEISENVEEEVVKVSSQTCFNCDNNHSLKDCPLPKDYAKINLKRQKFKAQRQTSRYHLEEDQKFSHLVPGKISDGLREALGLRKNQLPPYIYQMRILGYPPGWLEEAKFIYSNLEMFDSEGKNVEPNNSQRNQGLNSEKVIDYPGFNVPMEKHVKDEFRQYRVPPYSENYSKTVMLDFFAKQVDKNDSDMDLDSTVEEVVQEDLRNKLKPQLPNAILEIKDSGIGVPSPSLTDLERAKQNLLAELNDNSSSNPRSEENTSDAPEPKMPENPDEPDSQPSVISPEETPLDETLKIDIEAATDSSPGCTSPPLNCSTNSVKDSSFGTPILKSNSSFSRLPKAENFMKDVSPVINFENLPNSTGKYEQMTDVLQKVRNRMKHLQNCKS